MPPVTLPNSHRHDIIRLLSKLAGNVGVELGVAAGGFSKRMVESGAFEMFYGVDRYADVHDIDEYKKALRTVGLGAPYKLLRMTFDQALDLFADESLDFIYVDGYAHSGEDGGRTIFKWARKVRIGGVIAGDDYHPRWPLVVRAVDAFVAAAGVQLYVTSDTETSAYNEFPSWGVVKTAHVDAAPPPRLARAAWWASLLPSVRGALVLCRRSLRRALAGQNRPS